MKIYLSDQKRKFKQHLDFLMTKKVMSYDKSFLRENISTVKLKTDKDIQQLNLDFLFNYQIFPASIMAFKAQWIEENRSMKIGDTIVQQVYIPPIRMFSKKIIFGVRINEVIDQAYKKSFSYETLQGHVEKGVSVFTVEQINSNLIFKIRTHSAPGNFLVKLLGPVFSRPYQRFCTRSALKNVQRQIENQ
jgi:hypothetical protein